MKNGKNPTRQQQLIIHNNRLNPKNWLVVKAPPGELHIQHRESKKVRKLNIS